MIIYVKLNFAGAMEEAKKKQTFWPGVTALGVIILFFYLFALSFSSAPEDQPVKLYYVDNISQTHQKLIDRFNKKFYGQIEVVPVNLPFTKFSTNERKEILARSLRSKSERIDVFAVDVIWTPRFAKWSHPLDAYFSEQDTTKFLRPSLKTCLYRGHLMAAPLYLDIGLLYYRDDLLRELPDYQEIKQKLQRRLSWREFIKLANRLKREGRPVFLFSANNFEGLMCVFYELLTPDEIKKTFLNNPIRLNRPEISAALRHLHNLIHRYKLTPPKVTGFDEVGCYNYLLENNGYFLRGWPGFKLSVKSFNELRGTQAKIEFVEIPYFRTKKTKAVYGGWNLMIAKNSKHKKEAIKFIKFLQELPNQKLLFTSGGYLPSLKEVYHDSLLVRRFPALKQLHRLLLNGQHRPMRSDYTRISDILSFYFHQALKNEIGIEQALKLAEKEINTQQIILN